MNTKTLISHGIHLPLQEKRLFIFMIRKKFSVDIQCNYFFTGAHVMKKLQCMEILEIPNHKNNQIEPFDPINKKIPILLYLVNLSS